MTVTDQVDPTFRQRQKKISDDLRNHLVEARRELEEAELRLMTKQNELLRLVSDRALELHDAEDGLLMARTRFNRAAEMAGHPKVDED